MPTTYVRTPSIDKYVRNWKKSKSIMSDVGEKIVSYLLNQWINVKDASNKRMKRLKSKDYKKYKKSVGRRGVRDLFLTGDMRKDLKRKTLGKKAVRIYFKSKTQREKAEGNAAHAPNMMVLSKKQIKKLTEYILERLKK